VVGEQMIARDRHHQPAVGDGACPAAPAGEEPGDVDTGAAQPDPVGQPDTDKDSSSSVAVVVDAVVAATAAVAAVASVATDGGEQRDAGQRQGLEVYGDSAYGTSEARAAYQEGGHDTVIKPKPLRAAVPGGFTLDDFTIDEQW